MVFALFWCLCLNEKVGGCSPGSSAALLRPVAAAHRNLRSFCLLRRDCGLEVGHSHDSTWEMAPAKSPLATLKSSEARCHWMWAGRRGFCPSEVLLEPVRLDGYKELSFFFLFGHVILGVTFLNSGHRIFPKLFYNWHSLCPSCVFCCQIPAFRNVLFWFNFSRTLERRNCPVVKQQDWRPKDDQVWLLPLPQTSSVISGKSLNPSVC